MAVHAWAVAPASRSCLHGAASGPGGDQFERPRGVTVSTLDSESSDRGSNPREASSSSARRRRARLLSVSAAHNPWTHWGFNPGPSACKADVIPLHHVPSEPFLSAFELRTCCARGLVRRCVASVQTAATVVTQVCPRGQGDGLKIYCRQMRVGSNPHSWQPSRP